MSPATQAAAESQALPFDIEPQTPTIGATISGLDLKEPLQDEVISGLRAALVQWKVIFFRDQHLSEQEPLRQYRLYRPHPGYGKTGKRQTPGDTPEHRQPPRVPGSAEVAARYHRFLGQPCQPTLCRFGLLATAQGDGAGYRGGRQAALVCSCISVARGATTV